MASNSIDRRRLLSLGVGLAATALTGEGAKAAAPDFAHERAETSAAPESADPYEGETPAQRDVRMKWWREARFGMFIHWGVYSVPAGTYHGKRIDFIGEWIMNTAKIPCAEYQQYATQFNPVKYDADEWVRTAKEAGMKYIVITSKHHDGFAMFDTKASKWNIVQASPYRRDPLKELAAASHKHGIRLGFYYSQAQDWNNPGGAKAGGHWDPAQNGSMDDYVRNVAVPQVREKQPGTFHLVGPERHTEFSFARTVAMVCGLDADLIQARPAFETAGPTRVVLDRFKTMSALGRTAFRGVGDGVRAVRDRSRVAMPALKVAA